VCISEFHDNLKTDKSSGIFAAGGPWELSLRECLSGKPAAAAATAVLLSGLAPAECPCTGWVRVSP
jgi:hypothetical protein